PRRFGRNLGQSIYARLPILCSTSCTRVSVPVQALIRTLGHSPIPRAPHAMDSSELEQSFINRWDKTVLQCETGLEPDDLAQVRQVTSWESFRSNTLSDGTPHEISMIEPALGHLRQFTNMFDVGLAAGLKADFFWGIFNLLLRITTEDPMALNRIPRMIKSVGYKAEAFIGQCATSFEDRDEIKEACLDIQVQLVRFFTAAVQFLRSEELSTTTYGEGDPWQRLQRRFTSTNQELTETLARLESLAIVRRRADHGSAPDVTTTPVQGRLRCLMLPTKKFSRFFNRADMFDKIDQAIGGSGSSPAFRSVALYGLGGIGKSSVAARYIERKFEEGEYDTIFWVYAEKTASLRQSFTDIALRLKLDGAKPNLHDDNIILVQNWLQLTECKWLMVYDNAESADLLMTYWPETSHGRAIITTRNHALAYEPASSGLEITTWDETQGSEFLLFLLKDNIGKDIETEGLSACEISKKLSGHALAISSAAGLIQRRSWSISEYMRMYMKNPRRAHETEMQALWDLSFSTLDKDSRTCLGIAFSEAIEPLLTLALMKRDRDSREFSCHRMVQMQFQFYLPLEERQKFFYHAVDLLYRAFPKQTDENKNQLYQHWTECNRLLQHVLSLKDNFKQDPKLCDGYLFEANALDDLDDTCKVSLLAAETLEDKEKAKDLIAWTFSMQASMYESIGRVEEAIELNRRGYEMRLTEKPLKGRLLGAFQQNLAYNYNTANQHETALEWFEKSREQWAADHVQQGKEADWPPVRKMNMARCLFYLCRDSEAEKMLNESIIQFKEDKVLNWAMLAYAYFVHATIQRKANRLEAAEASFIEAQNLWLRGDHTKLHPFYAGCIYKTGVVCLDQGKIEAAVKHLREAVEMTKFHAKVMPVEHGRCLFKLSEALLQDGYDGDAEEGRDLRDEAEIFLSRRDPKAVEFGKEDCYDVFVPIFWR
ncbi:hypothetical protein LLEC1_00074, partial [Akanthomyces lecanii]